MRNEKEDNERFERTRALEAVVKAIEPLDFHGKRAVLLAAAALLGVNIGALGDGR